MIIAVDFDGVLCENQFPRIGPPNYRMISMTRELIDNGNEVVLWTSRVDNRLDEAVKWCEDLGLHFCAVNGSAPSNVEKYGTNPRKIFADVYIDDHSIGSIFGDPGYTERCMEKLVRLLKSDKEGGKS